MDTEVDKNEEPQSGESRDWYTVDEIRNWDEAQSRGIVGCDLQIDESGTVTDTNAVWLTAQLNAAFLKGQQLERDRKQVESPSQG